ncbi:hypothetical protein IFM89_038097, partial [Coptis chinensis]
RKVRKNFFTGPDICETPAREEDNLSLEKTPEATSHSGGGGSIITIIHAIVSWQKRGDRLNFKDISTTNLPWLLMGDFNAYLSCSEKQGGNRPSAGAMHDFCECVSNSQLMEVPSNGFHHTWWNK